jgi:polar amino acid transport system substrate-binding protein
MRRRFLKWLVAAVVIAAPVFSAWAADTNAPVLARIAESGTLRVGMSAGQPPFNVTNRDGEIIGMDVDLATLLARAIEVELEIVEMPFGDLLPALGKGDIDLVMSGMTATLPRNMQAAFVGPYYVSGKSMLTKSATIAAVQESEDLKENLRITALRGSTSADWVTKAIPTAKLTATDDYDEAIDLLLADKADAMVADAAICQLMILRFPDAGLATSNRPLTLEPISIAVPPNDPLFLNLITNYLTAMRAAGALEKLHEKWFKSGGWLMQLP